MLRSATATNFDSYVVCVQDFVGVVWLGNGTGGQGQQLTEPRTAILSSRAGMRPTALRQAFDGSIYYISRQNADRFGGSTLRRITFAGDHGGQSGVTTDAPVDGNDDSTPTVATGSTSSSALAVYPGTGSAGSEGSGDEGEDDTPYPGLALVEALEHIYVDPGVGEAPLTVHFDIGWHFVPDDAKDVLETDCSFNWGFGDYHADGPLDRSVVNQPSSVGVHEYTAAGVFAAHVTVVCNDITFVSSSASIQVVDEPADEFLAMAIGTPSNNDVFVAGTTIMLTVDDGDSASNPDREIEWHIELQHSGHTHPITRLTGHAVSFSVPTQGHGFPNDSCKTHTDSSVPLFVPSLTLTPPPLDRPPCSLPPRARPSPGPSCLHLGGLSHGALFCALKRAFSVICDLFVSCQIRSA